MGAGMEVSTHPILFASKYENAKWVDLTITPFNAHCHALFFVGIFQRVLIAILI
jgi:hypothetical protein